MEVLKGYGRFLVLVVTNAGFLGLAVTKLLEISDSVGWDAVGCAAASILFLAIFAGVFYVTGSVTGEGIE